MKKLFIILNVALLFTIKESFAQSLISVYESPNLRQPFRMVDEVYLATENTNAVATRAGLFSRQETEPLFSYETGRGVYARRLAHKANGGWIVGIDELTPMMRTQVKVFDLDEDFNQINSYVISSPAQEEDNVVIGDLFSFDGDIIVWGSTDENTNQPGVMCGKSLFLERMNGNGEVYSKIVHTTVTQNVPSDEIAHMGMIYGDLFLGTYTVIKNHIGKGKISVFNLSSGALLDTATLGISTVKGLISLNDTSFCAYGYILDGESKKLSVSYLSVSALTGDITINQELVFDQQFEPMKAVLIGRSLLLVGFSQREETESILFPQARVIMIDQAQVVWDYKIPVPLNADNSFQSSCVDVIISDEIEILVHTAENFFGGGVVKSTAQIYKIDGLTSLGDTPSPDELFEVYPNPSDGAVVIESPQEGLIVEVYNPFGSLIDRVCLPKGQTNYQLEASSGLYIFTTRLGSKRVYRQ